MKMFGVTETLSPWANEKFQKQGVSKKRLGIASGKGTLVHDWCLNGYALGLPKPALPEIYKGYGESFRLWFDKYVDKVIWVEKELRDEELGIIGHPDLLCIANFGKGLIFALPDIKTPVEFGADFWEAQLGAYLHLVQKAGWDPEWIGSLQLDIRGGWPKPKRFGNKELAFAKFLVALQARRIFG